MPIQRFVVGPMGNNTYVVFDEASREAAIVDPGKGASPVLEWARSRGLRPRYVLNTHGHSDHTFDNGMAMQETDADLMIGEPDEAMLEALAKGDGWLGKPDFPSPMADAYLEHEQELALGATVIRVLHTPGHTPGSSCFVYEDSVLTGDTLFQGSIGRTDFPGGSFPEIVKSIESRLYTLSPETRVLPGHMEVSTIIDEKLNNPFVGEGARIDLTQLEKD